MSTKTITMHQSIKDGTGFILPPHPTACQICAVEHEPELPHDATSFFYQMYMTNVKNAEATRANAMEHCKDDIKEQRTKALTDRGIDINSINVRGK